MELRRGDIVYVDIPHATGCEMMKDRPGVVVSNNAMNFAGQVVCVVYLTGRKKQEDRPYHVEVKSTVSVRHGASTALCEQIYTVDKSRLGRTIGSCTEEEMAAIDNGILLSLALGDGKYKLGKRPLPAKASVTTPEDEHGERLLRAELETYKRLYWELLERVVRTA